MKTVTEVRRSSAGDTFIAECLSCTEFFVGLGANGDPVMWSILRVFFQYEASSTVLYATKALDRGSRQARKERTAVVVA